MMFRTLDELVVEARSRGPVRIAVAAGHDPDVIGAMKQAAELNLAQGIYIGRAAEIFQLAAEAGLDIPADQVIDEPQDEAAARRAVAFVREGQAGFVMKGKISTAKLARAVLDRQSGLRTGHMLSQVIVFQVPGFDRLMLLTDAAINIAPNLEQKAELCRNAFTVAHAIGIANPNLAALCAVESVNENMVATVDAAGLAVLNRLGELSGGFVDGPIALDAPLSRFAAERKGIDSPLVENTDIFLAPDIEAANILYRAIVYFAKGVSCGIVVGAKVPLVFLSRAETPETKLRSIALAVLVANHKG